MSLELSSSDVSALGRVGTARLHAGIESPVRGLGRWHRTLCAKRQVHHLALVPTTRGPSEKSAACDPGVSPPQATPQSRPPGSSGGSRDCLLFPSHRAVGRCDRSCRGLAGDCVSRLRGGRPWRALRSPGVSLLALSLTTWLMCCLWHLPGFCTVKAPLSTFSTLHLGAGSPPRAAHAEGAESPSPRWRRTVYISHQGSGSGGSSLLHSLIHSITCSHQNGLISWVTLTRTPELLSPCVVQRR